MRVGKSKKSSASTWRKRDAAYRAEQKKRRKANAERRAESAEAGARGITVEQLRAERAEA